MEQNHGTAYIIINEDGSHIGLTREFAPSDVHVSNAAKALEGQNRKGFLARVEGDIRTPSGVVTNMQAINQPSVPFEEVKQAFVRKNSRVGVRPKSYV